MSKLDSCLGKAIDTGFKMEHTDLSGVSDNLRRETRMYLTMQYAALDRHFLAWLLKFEFPRFISSTYALLLKWSPSKEGLPVCHCFLCYLTCSS